MIEIIFSELQNSRVQQIRTICSRCLCVISSKFYGRFTNLMERSVYGWRIDQITVFSQTSQVISGNFTEEFNILVTKVILLMYLANVLNVCS